MKKLFIMTLVVAGTLFADTGDDFRQVVEKYGCSVEVWKTDTYESGADWKYYAKVVCDEKQKMPARIATLKFLDGSTNLMGKYVVTYGEEK